MSYTDINKFILDYCQTHGINLVIDSTLKKNDGISYPYKNEIRLSSKYSSYLIKIAVFMHEIGHFTLDKTAGQSYNTLECETLAWAEGMKLYRKYFNKSFSKTQFKFMFNCLKTYHNYL